MTKKEYIEKLENLIVQRIKYHAPKFADVEIDYGLLEAVGIDSKLPIFIFKKPLNKVFFKAFEKAKKHVEFNLILIEKPLVNIKKIHQLEKTFLIFKDEIGCNLFNTLDSLNINYISHSSFMPEFKKEYLKINDQYVNFEYMPYFYTKKNMFDGVEFDIKQYLLNGKNTQISVINTRSTNQSVQIEINIPLPRGYYFFKREDNFVEIKNLTTNEKAYFNFNFKNSKIIFSSMSGLESCTFACINLLIQTELMPKQKKIFYFNFGEAKYCITNLKLLDYFFQLSQQKLNEIFDIKVRTNDFYFDNTFNCLLPQKIWEKWQKFDVDEESINKWLKIKAQIVKYVGKGIQISSELKGLKEVQIFQKLKWKKVFVLHNNSNYMYIDKVKYFNYNLLTKEIFEKNNEIYLSFADL